MVPSQDSSVTNFVSVASFLLHFYKEALPKASFIKPFFLVLFQTVSSSGYPDTTVWLAVGEDGIAILVPMS